MRLAALSLAISLAYVPGIPSAANAGRWAALGLGAALLVFTFRIKPTPGHYLFFGLLSWMSASFVWSVSPFDTVGEVLQWAVAFVVFALAAEERDMTWHWRALAAGVFVSAPYVVMQRFGINPVLTLGDWHMATGLWLTKNMLIEIAAVALIGAITLSGWWRALAIGPAICLWFASGREPYIMLLAALISWWWIQTAFRGRTLAVVGIAGWLVFLWRVGSFDNMGGLAHFSDRAEIWKWTVENLTPLGTGLGSYGAIRDEYEFAHNEILHYAFELGGGVALLVGIFAYALWSGPVLERVALAALGAACLVWFPLHAPGTLYLFAILAGFICGARRRGRDLEYQRRADSGVGAYAPAREEPVGVGALCLADAGRPDLPFRPEYPAGPRLF